MRRVVGPFTGIEDFSIFELNVRLGLGKTRINKELAITIGKGEEHALFPAYHNGLTLLTTKFEETEDGLTLSGVSVVNGCQSLLALFDNRKLISPSLRILVKVIELGERYELVDKITYRTNNQNPVNLRDQRSTDRVQRDLQTQVRQAYGSELAYLIRNGEKHSTPAVLDNTVAAQLAMAVYLQEPWNAVRKVKLFDEEYHRVFSRDLDAHKLYLLHQLNGVITAKKGDLRADLESSFASVRFTLLHLLAKLLRRTDQGNALLDTPEKWMPELRALVVASLDELADEVIDSVNFYVQAKEEEALAAGETPFDPKVAFKSRSGVQLLERDVILTSRRLEKRTGDYGFRLEPAVRTAVKKVGRTTKVARKRGS